MLYVLFFVFFVVPIAAMQSQQMPFFVVFQEESLEDLLAEGLKNQELQTHIQQICVPQNVQTAPKPVVVPDASTGKGLQPKSAGDAEQKNGSECQIFWHDNELFYKAVANKKSKPKTKQLFSLEKRVIVSLNFSPTCQEEKNNKYTWCNYTFAPNNNTQ